MLTRIPPDWDVSLDTLYRVVSNPDKRWQRARLTLPEAVSELIESTSLRHGRRMSLTKRDWHSLRQEVITTCAELDKITQQSSLALLVTCGSEYTDLQNAIKVSPNHYQRINGSAEALLAKLKLNQACVSAWNDLIHHSAGLRYDAFAYLRDTFITVAQLQGHGDDSGTFRLVAGVLGDTAYQVIAAQKLAKAPSGKPPSNPTDFAGQSKNNRLELTRRIWSHPTRTAENVVWIRIQKQQTG